MATLDDAFAAAFPGETEAPQEEVSPEPDPVEEEVIAEAETGEPEVEERLYAGKYKTVEELEAAYGHAESKIGSQGDELGKLRQEFQEKFDELGQQQQPAFNPFEAQSDWDNFNFDNAALARQTALWVAQNQPYQYDSFLETWYDNSPRAATAFEMELQKYEVQQQIEERFGPVSELPEKIAADERAQQNVANFEQVWANVRAQNADLDQFAEKIIEEASQTPALAAVFQNGDVEQMSGALNLLLNSARFRHSQAEGIAAAQETEAAQRAKSKGNLTKATASAGSQSKTPTSGDRILEALERESRERGWWGEK